MKKKAEEDQEKEEGEITDEDSDNENIDNLLAKTRNRFLVISKRNGNPVSKPNPAKKRSPPNINNIDADFTSLPEKEIKVIKSFSKEKEVSKEKIEEDQEKEEGEIQATWKMVEGKVKILSDTR